MPRTFDPSRPERMDLPQPVSPELEKDLDNLRKLNRWFGSYRLVCYFLHRWLKRDSRVRILDLATGSGDIPREIVLWCRARKIHVDVDAVDFHPSTLAIARIKSAAFPEIRYHQADARNFSSTEKWDIVICSLALHHFSDEDAVAILRRSRELSAHYVLISDLCRTLFGKIGIWLLTATIFREPMTRHDARVSIARAFSFSEFRKLAMQSGWKKFGHRRFPSHRQALWLEVR